MIPYSTGRKIIMEQTYDYSITNNPAGLVNQIQLNALAGNFGVGLQPATLSTAGDLSLTTGNLTGDANVSGLIPSQPAAGDSIDGAYNPIALPTTTTPGQGSKLYKMSIRNNGGTSMNINPPFRQLAQTILGGPAPMGYPANNSDICWLNSGHMINGRSCIIGNDCWMNALNPTLPITVAAGGGPVKVKFASGTGGTNSTYDPLNIRATNGAGRHDQFGWNALSLGTNPGMIRIEWWISMTWEAQPTAFTLPNVLLINLNNDTAGWTKRLEERDSYSIPQVLSGNKTILTFSRTYRTGAPAGLIEQWSSNDVMSLDIFNASTANAVTLSDVTFVIDYWQTP